jgi:hypothetical protein
MSPKTEPNPPSRKDEDFPKTTTIPSGWVMEELMEVYNRNGSVADRGVSIPVPATGAASHSNGKTHAADETPTRAEEELFSRRLEPFVGANDMLHRMYL